MPEQKGKPQEEPKGKPQEDDFISKIVKDPAQPPDVLLLTGYLGASSEPGYTRLYFDPQETIPERGQTERLVYPWNGMVSR
jgi:hypothetical protein